MERPAGFWIRFLAYVIDQIIIGIPIFIIQFMVSFLFAAGVAAADPFMTENQFNISFLVFGVIPILASSFVISILYFSLLTASKMQGTLGKALLGLKVLRSSMRMADGYPSARPSDALSHISYLSSFFISDSSWAPSERKKRCTTSCAAPVLSINNDLKSGPFEPGLFYDGCARLMSMPPFPSASMRIVPFTITDSGWNSAC